MKQWEDWIIFLGFEGDQYDNVMGVLKHWNELLSESGLNQDNLCQLRKWLFLGSGLRIYHACCLALSSMHVEDCWIKANWVDGGGLPELNNEYDRVENKEFSVSYNNYPIKDTPAYFLTAGDYHVIGMTLDGKFVMDTYKKLMDTYKKYNHRVNMQQHMLELGNHDYSKEFLETVNENYRMLQLPVVPKGILKLPSSI